MDHRYEVVSTQPAESHAAACARACDAIRAADTAEEVILLLVSPIRPEYLAGQPATREERALWAASVATIQAIHKKAIETLRTAAPVEFEEQLRHQCTVNLEPCRCLFPKLHAAFEKALRHAIRMRWLLEMRQFSKHLH